MKLLLDENMPEKIRQIMDSSHEVYTVRYMGWSGLKNGQLLKAMVEAGFEGLVTMDKALPSQHNMKKYPALFL